MKYKYDLPKCEINGQKFYFNEIKINISQEIPRVTHSGSYDPIDYINGDITVNFNLTYFEDAEETALFYDAFREINTFEMRIFDKNDVTKPYKLVGILEGCRLTSPTSGMALNYR